MDFPERPASLPASANRMKASDYIVKFLEDNGITHVFGCQGGMITHLVDSLSKSNKTKFIPCYHEQSAAFAAEGYARASKRFGVCITTSGPGATNTITSIADAYFDSIPVLFITGQVNSYEYKYDRPIRQRGFQETDIVSVVRPIVKWVKLCDNPQTLATDLSAAITAMTTGRKGPVVLDIPMDVQRSDIANSPVPVLSAQPKKIKHLPLRAFQKALDTLSSARRPLVLCGGGIAAPTSNRLCRLFLSRTQLPYVTSLMGKGLVCETSRRHVGMIGSYGNRCANNVLAEADAVLCLGSRVDLRQTGNRKSPGLCKTCFIRIDVDPFELDDAKLPNQLAIHANLDDFISYALQKGFPTAPQDWQKHVSELKSRYSQIKDVRAHLSNSLPYDVLGKLNSLAPSNALYVTDIGQNQMWAAQTIRCKRHQSFYTSGGMAPMGYAIPVSVGAAFANPRRHVICICGDGGLHMSTQSLLLVSQHRLPITIIVMNNEALGMITQFQRQYFNGNLAATVKASGYLTPNFAKLSSSYDLNYHLVRKAQDFNQSLLSANNLIEIRIKGLPPVVPKLPFNHNLTDMIPPWKPQ